ncbi:7-cyano-7-deazaguanine synthase [Streptosporangium sp. NPDC049248]|uniref:7-cyano-7-deazaguanine synthase n=1 Tax=Streptosporangium sp. NPDC049248 TaxID=3155651 RepID=UPI00342D5DC1
MPPTGLSDLPAEVLLWRTPPETSSFHTPQLDPWATTLGAPPPATVDLLRIAVAAYIADRLTPRHATAGDADAPVDRWSRTLRLTIEVTDVERCAEVRDQVQWLLGFLTGDMWELAFTAGPRTPLTPRRKHPPSAPPANPDQVVCLFSGGADSTCGVLTALHRTGTLPVLISHWDATVTSNAQKQVVTALGQLIGPADLQRLTRADLDEGIGRQWHRIRLGRRPTQLGSAIRFGTENSSRSRSLLFLTLGAAVAAQGSGTLWVPENGYLSLNLPLASERGSSLTTRTTHPLLLHRLQELFDALQIPVLVHNPFTAMTKAEMFTATAALYHPRHLAGVLAATHSCAKANLHFHGFPDSTHCGLCYACLVRRSAFLAAGWSDPTSYIETSLPPGDVRRTAFITPARRLDYQTVQAAAVRGLSIGDVITHQLPAGTDYHAALRLAQRGLAEVAAVHIS